MRDGETREREKERMKRGEEEKWRRGVARSGAIPILAPGSHGIDLLAQLLLVPQARAGLQLLVGGLATQSAAFSFVPFFAGARQAGTGSQQRTPAYIVYLPPCQAGGPERTDNEEQVQP